MDYTFETQDKENSRVLLKITVKKDEIKKEYNNFINEAQKNAQIKGFRKGKVPISVLEQKYKEGFLAETGNKVIENAYKEIFDKLEKKPIPYSTPALDDFKLPELDKDYIFTLIYDVFPEYSFGEIKNIEIEKDTVKISDKDIQNEIDRYLKEFTTVEAKKGSIESGDIAVIDYTVNENGSEIYKKENEYIYVGKNYDPYKIGDDIIGLQKDNEKEFEKKYSDNENDKLKGKKLQIKVKINEVKSENKPELTDELAKQINESCETVKDLKNRITEDLNKYSENFIKQQALNNAMKKIIETFKGDIPESMIEEQKKSFYNNMLSQFGGDEKKLLNALKRENLTKESYFEKINDDAVYEIKKGLITQKIVKEQKIEASDEDINNYIEPIAKNYKMKPEEFLKMYKDAGKLDFIKNEIEIKKAFDYFYDNLKVKKGKKINFSDLFNQQNQ